MTMTTEALLQRYQRRRDRFMHRQGEADLLREEEGRLLSLIDGLQTKIQLYGKTLALLHSLSEAIHEQFLRGIEALVSDGLRTVFGGSVNFHIESTTRGNAVNLDFSVSDRRGVRQNPLESRGGGVAALVGVVLRIVVVRLLNGRVRPVLILDEPLAHLSEDYTAAAARMLASLAAQLDIQVLMVSHQEQFAEYADKIYRLERQGEATVVVS